MNKSKIRIFKVNDSFEEPTKTKPYSFKLYRYSIEQLIEDIKNDAFVFSHTIEFY